MVESLTIGGASQGIKQPVAEKKIKSVLNARNVTKIWKGSLSTWKRHIKARATPPRCVISVGKFSGTKTPLGPTSLPTATRKVNVPPV